MLVRLSIWLNPIVAAILRSRFHWLLSPGLMLITVSGRRTGRRYTIPVGYHHVEDAVIILVAEAPSKVWWRNYRKAGPIELRLRGKEFRGSAAVVPAGSAEFRQRAEASFSRTRLIPWIFGIDYDRKTGLTDAQAKQLAEQAVIVRVSVDEAR
jgi:deazaflavin-dependent oxidoreductase (nitroreductase family)